MHFFDFYIVPGLVIGCIYAIAASGLIVTSNEPDGVGSFNITVERPAIDKVHPLVPGR